MRGSVSKWMIGTLGRWGPLPVKQMARLAGTQEEPARMPKTEKRHSQPERSFLAQK